MFSNNKLLIGLVLCLILILSILFFKSEYLFKNSNLIKYSNSFFDNKKNEENIYDMILKNPNDFAFKYVNLPLDYGYGSNSIPLAICGLIADGDLLELGMVIDSNNLKK